MWTPPINKSDELTRGGGGPLVNSLLWEVISKVQYSIQLIIACFLLTHHEGSLEPLVDSYSEHLYMSLQQGTVTFFIQTFFIRDKVYTNFLYTGQSLYGTKFIQDKVYTGTKYIRGQSLYGDKVYMGQSSYGDKVYTGTKFILHT